MIDDCQTIKHWAVYSKLSDQPCRATIDGHQYIFIQGCPIPGDHLGVLLVGAAVHSAYLESKDFDIDTMNQIIDPLFKPLAIEIEASTTQFVIEALRSYLTSDEDDTSGMSVLDRATILLDLLEAPEDDQLFDFNNNVLASNG